MIYSKSENAACLRDFRENIGLSQNEFSIWLCEHGVTGRNGEPYDPKTIAAWENGRRNVPQKVLNLTNMDIAEAINVNYIKNKETLADYTTDELLAEIKRRIEEK